VIADRKIAFFSQLAGAFMFGGYGGKTLLIFSVLLWSLSTIVTPLVAPTSTAALIFFRILLGIGEGLGKNQLLKIHLQ
jgi:MFS family permease